MAGTPPPISLTKLGRLIRFTLWPTVAVTDFSRGIIKDSPRSSIPAGAVYDSTDYLLHQPGVAQKRGGTAYAGPTMASATFATSVIHVPFTAAAQLIATGANAHLFKITAGTTT